MRLVVCGSDVFASNRRSSQGSKCMSYRQFSKAYSLKCAQATSVLECLADDCRTVKQPCRLARELSKEV